MTAVAVRHDPVSHEPTGGPSGRPLDITGLAGWPLPVSRIDFDEGLAFLHALDSGGYTVDDLEHAPHDQRRWELLDGVVVVSPAPSYRHQRVVLNLGMTLRMSEVGPARTLIAPFDVPVSVNKKFQPDVLVLSDQEATPPVLAVEVLSRYGRTYDTQKKRTAYQDAGIRSYWVVDPEVPSVTVHLLGRHGVYEIAATVRGDDRCEIAEPFPVTLRPTDLLA
ncbi:Uma2 family endonuclease [Protofrankia symbiont of Coriaria ruscifolia]|uniref:Uma2 family endonuclease n=1 Tax=Protofrankia symbiont of Coriaria ruscifolia TaxID=1306542 RepID=UPI0013EF6AF4|nr:Uma2 family endonuclease [Protofrankia symbiont of Coriaria ruscifolia]